jgi:hypothetical protein
MLAPKKVVVGIETADAGHSRGRLPVSSTLSRVDEAMPAA